MAKWFCLFFSFEDNLPRSPESFSRMCSGNKAKFARPSFFRIRWLLRIPKILRKPQGSLRKGKRHRSRPLGGVEKKKKNRFSQNGLSFFYFFFRPPPPASLQLERLQERIPQESLAPQKAPGIPIPKKGRSRGPAATRRAATLSRGSEYCACHTDRSRGPAATRRFLEALSTAQRPFLAVWVLRLPHRREPRTSGDQARRNPF